MGIFVPITTYIQYGEISAYLAASNTATNNLFRGADLIPTLSEKIEIVRKAIQWKFTVNSSDESLNDTSLYLYALCGRFILEAKRVLNTGVSGQVINPSTGNQVTIATPSYQFRVGEGGALMTAGQTSLTISLSGVINPSLEITLDGTELPYGRSDVLSYTATYNPTNVVIVFNQGVVNNQLYFIHMVQLVNI